MPSLRSSPWILGAPHNGLAPLIWRISWRISTVTAGRPQRCFDFHRQYDLNPPRCQRITVSGRTIASAPYILGNSRQTSPNIDLVNRNKSKSLRISAPQHIDLLPESLPQSPPAPATGPWQSQRSVDTNLASGTSIARFSINCQHD
jgi:hypothetical protein